jgi:hypothetical protein
MTVYRAGIDKISNKTHERLMLGSRLASSAEVYDLDLGLCSPGRRVGLVQDEHPTVASRQRNDLSPFSLW